MKKILAILLTVAMLFSVAAISASAAETDVAAIGEATYATLADAITAAKAGDTITLLGDVTENVTISKSITLDGGNNKYTGNITTSSTKANVVIKNVNFVDCADNYAIKSNGASSLTVENCTAANCSWGLLYANKSTNTITMKNVEINDSTRGLRINYNSTTTLENVTMKNVKYGIESLTYGERTFTFKNCTIEATDGSFVAIDKGAKVQTLNFKDSNDFGMIVKTLESETIKVNLDAAKIGDTVYASLAAAIAAAKSGDTITLLADIVENVTINKSITIDGAGKKYIGNITVSNSNANLVVKNVNFVDYADNYAIKSSHAKSVTIENCTATNCGWGLFYAAKSTPTITVKNVEIDGATRGLRIAYNEKSTLENVTMKNVKYGIESQTFSARTFNFKNCTIAATDAPFVAIDKGAKVQTLNFKGINDFGIDLRTLESDLVKVNLDVALVGTETYATLKEAVAVAADGDVIKIIADFTIANTDVFDKVSGMYPFVAVTDKKVTIDLNGKVITVNPSLDANMLAVFYAGDAGELTIKDSSEAKTGAVNVTMADGTQAYSMFTALGSAKMYIESGNYSIDKVEYGQSMIYAGQDKQLFVSGGDFYLGNAKTKDPGNGEMQPWIYNAHGDGVKAIVVTGGTYNVDPTHYHGEAAFPQCKAAFELEDGKWGLDDSHTPGAAATCQAAQTCTVCGTEIDAIKNHTYETYVSNNDATCTADGTKTAECIYACGEKDTVTDKGTIKPHTPGAAATCMAPQTCTVCGTKLDAIKEHKFGEYVSDNNAECTVDGTKSADCIYGCGHKDTVTDKGTAFGHSDEDGNGRCDSCNTEYCDTCGRVHEDWMSMLICLITDFINLIVSFFTSIG